MGTSKSILLGIIVLCFIVITTVWAGDLEMEAGSTLTFTPDYGMTRVHCKGSTNFTLPVCKVKKNVSYNYDILIDNDKIDTMPSFEQAIERIKILKTNQLCQ